MGVRVGSRVARWKMARVLRIPAGDPAEGESECDCGGNFLLTESSIPIETEGDVNLSPES